MNAVIIPLKWIHGYARHRPAGYVEECLARGTVHHDALVMTAEVYIELCLKYRDPKSLVKSSLQAMASTNVIDCPNCRDKKKLSGPAAALTLGQTPEWKMS